MQQFMLLIAQPHSQAGTVLVLPISYPLHQCWEEAVNRTKLYHRSTYIRYMWSLVYYFEMYSLVYYCRADLAVHQQLIAVVL